MGGPTEFRYPLCNVGTRGVDRASKRQTAAREGFVPVPHLLPHPEDIEADVDSSTGDRGFDKYNNAFHLEEVRRIGDEYGVTTKSLGIFKTSITLRRLIGITTGLGGS